METSKGKLLFARFRRCNTRVKYLGRLGSDCGSAGRAVTSETRGPWFDCSHKRFFILTIEYCIENTKLNKKVAGMVNFFKIGVVVV